MTKRELVALVANAPEDSPVQVWDEERGAWDEPAVCYSPAGIQLFPNGKAATICTDPQ